MCACVMEPAGMKIVRKLCRSESTSLKCVWQQCMWHVRPNTDTTATAQSEKANWFGRPTDSISCSRKSERDHFQWLHRHDDVLQCVQLHSIDAAFNWLSDIRTVRTFARTFAHTWTWMLTNDRANWCHIKYIAVVFATDNDTPHTGLRSSVNFHFSCFRSCIASWRESSVFRSTWTFYRCGQPQKPANEHAIIIIIIGDNIFISLHVAMCRFCHMWCVLLVLLQLRNGHQMTWNK